MTGLILAKFQLKNFKFDLSESSSRKTHFDIDLSSFHDVKRAERLQNLVSHIADVDLQGCGREGKRSAFCNFN